MQIPLMSRTLVVTLSLVACDLPEEVVGETADVDVATGGDDSTDDSTGAPTDDEEPSEDPTEGEDPTGDDEPPELDPPSALPTVVTSIGGALAVDDTWLYIAAGNVPVRVLKSGGEPEALAESTNSGSAVLIAVDAAYVYWTIGGTSNAEGFQVNRAPKAGGDIELVTNEFGPNNARATALAVDETHVYLSQPDLANQNDDPELLRGVIRRVPKAGGDVQEISDDYSYSLALSDANLFWARARTDGGSDLIRAATDGSEIEVASSELGDIFQVAAVGNRVYWTVIDAGEQSLRTMEIGEEAQDIFAQPADDPSFLATPAVTPNAVFWLRPGSATEGAVLTVDLAGDFAEVTAGPAASTLQTFGGPYGDRIVLDDDAIYWSYEGLQGGSPRVYRVAR